jgi:hypothetical protein
MAERERDREGEWEQREEPDDDVDTHRGVDGEEEATTAKQWVVGVHGAGEER